MKVREFKEQEARNDKQEEIKAAERAKRLYEQDLLKKFQKTQSEKDRMTLIMQEN